MGETEPNYADQLRKNLIRMLNSNGQDDWGYLIFKSIHYQKPLQDSQTKYFQNIKNKIDWSPLRKFFVYSFSDPVSLETRKDENNSPYEVCQKSIMETIDSCLSEILEMNEELPPVVILAQSLGGQVISNYIWDAQRKKVAGRQPKSGIWKGVGPNDIPIGSTRDRFRRLESLRCLITTGCNIPLFLAGDPNPKAIDTSYFVDSFEWLNYYDADDVLGYPLSDLSSSYKEIVQDIVIQSGRGLIQETPFSHVEYWATGSFLDQLTRKLREIINE